MLVYLHFYINNDGGVMPKYRINRERNSKEEKIN